MGFVLVVIGGDVVECCYVGFQYQFIDCFLFGIEVVIGGEGMGDVVGVVVDFVVGIDQDQVVVFDCCIVFVVVQDVGVVFGGDD